MNNTLSSYIYKFSERILTHATTFVVSIVLARLLTPADYGTLAIILVFVTLAQVLIDGGLGSSLIQKQEVTEKDYDTILTITIILALIAYLLLFVSANSLEEWFGMEGLGIAFKVVALVLFPSAYLSVIKSKLIRQMRFKEQMYVTFVCSLLSGGLGILMAYKGMGIWALIAQQISISILMVISYVLLMKWIPKIIFKLDLRRAKTFYDYGYKIMLTNLLVRGNNEIISLAIGKHFSKESLGLYDRGKQFPQAAAENFEGTIASVLFPILSRCQNDKELVKLKTRNMQEIGALINYFMLPLIAASSLTYIPLLLTEKWSGCIPLLILWTICYFPSIYMVVSTTAINSVGNSNMTLKRQLLTTIPTLLLTLLVVFFSSNVISVMIMKVFFIPYSFLVTGYYLYKSIGYTILEQLRDQAPYFISGLIVFLIVYIENTLEWNPLAVLFVQLASSIVVYFSIAYFFQFRAFKEIVSLLLKKGNN